VSLPQWSWPQLLGFIGPLLIASYRRGERLRLRDRFVQRLNTLLME
jgi:hypothetical protein